MENNIKFIPTLLPTFDQWKSLPVYLIHHETSLQRRFGAVKLIPPSRWIPLIKNPYDLRHIKMYIKQEIIRSSHQSDVFYIQNSETIKRRFMTYDEFKTIAESDAYRLKDTIDTNFTDSFWSTISNNITLNVPNIDDSLFAKREGIFNMANLASLLKYYPKSIPGVTTPFLHMGMWSSSVGLHIDEHDLISLNYLHHGAPKIWYIIHPSSYSKLEELVNKLKLFSDLTSSCLSPLQHKSLLIKPSFLHFHEIEYYQIEQKINELIIIFPGIYHCYFDTGFNLSETIKYALPSWLEFQRRSPRLCSCSISSSESSANLNRRVFTTEILDQFQQEYLKAIAPTCIDLSADDDDNEKILPTSSIEQNHNSTVEMEVVVPIPIQIDMSLDQYIDPLYSSSTNSNTSISTDLLSTINNSNEQQQQHVWNIFEQIPSQTDTHSIPHDYHPYGSYSSSIYPSFFPRYPYPSSRTYPTKRCSKRRRCYGCRKQGHIRKACPYLSHK